MSLRAFAAVALAALTLAAPTLAGPARAQTWPLQVTDDRNQAITIPARPQRVAAVATTATDFLVAVGMRPVAIARTGDRILPAFLGDAINGIPDLGSRAAPNLERLAELRPDLIVAMRRYTEANARKYEEIAPYLAFDISTLADSDRAIMAMGRALGIDDRARGLNEGFARLMAELAQRAPGGVSAALLWGDAQPFVYYDHYLTAHLMNVLKIQNVIGPSPTPNRTMPIAYNMSLEDLLLRDPEILFVFLPEEIHPETNPVWRRLRAVRNGRAYAVGVQWMESQGPIGREMVLREMAWLAYPTVFPRPTLPEGVQAVALPRP